MKRLTRTILTALMTILFLSGTVNSAFAHGGQLTQSVATVNASALRLRSQPNTAAATLAYAAQGEYVIILGKTGQWYHVSYNLTDGYMHENYLTTYDRRNVELGYGSVNGNKVNVRSGPGTSYSSLTRANIGDQAYIIGFNNQWYKVIYNSQIGYIRSDYLNLTQVPLENRASKQAPLFFKNGISTGVTPSASALQGTTGMAQKIISEAKMHLGVPYLWGGTTPKGFDCSGYVQYVFAKNGITLPRTTTEQYKIGTYVSKSKLQPGDLVFLQNTYREGISHVGIYIGDGKMIHASSSKGVVISDLSSSYYLDHYYGARRVL
jgi:cell wall-associated NlpC family hydrolase